MQIRDRVSCFLRLQRQMGVGDGLPCKQAHSEAPCPPLLMHTCTCMYSRIDGWPGGPSSPAALRSQPGTVHRSGPGPAAAGERGQRKRLRAPSPTPELPPLGLYAHPAWPRSHIGQFFPLGGNCALFRLLLSKPHPCRRGPHSALGGVSLLGSGAHTVAGWTAMAPQCLPGPLLLQESPPGGK